MVWEQEPYWKKKKIPLFLKSINNLLDINPELLQTSDRTTRYVFEKPLFLIENKIECVSNITNSNNTKKNTSPEVMKQLWLNLINNYYQDNTLIFTDGSKDKHGCGAAYFIPELHVQALYSLNRNMSSFTTELVAIYKAIHYIKESDHEKFLVCTDSQAAVKTMDSVQKGEKGPNLAFSILLEILHCPKKISLIWTPGHIGISHNEKVDELAKRAITRGEKCHNINVPILDITSVLKLKEYELINKMYQQSNKAQWYKGIVSTVNRRPWFKNQNIPRKAINQICRLKFGHRKVNSTLFKVNLSFTPLCLNCTDGVIENPRPYDLGMSCIPIC